MVLVLFLLQFLSGHFYASFQSIHLLLELRQFYAERIYIKLHQTDLGVSTVS